MKSSKAFLVLEDGTAFEGRPFGRRGHAVGETVFYTGVVGYQEVLTDPSYAGTLTVLTYPIIGSYGINEEDNETVQTHPRGLIIRNYSRHISNFRATGKLEEFLVERGVVGIQGVDTRAVAVHLREHGEMKGIIASGAGSPDRFLRQLRKTPSPWEKDLVTELQEPEIPRARGRKKHKLVALNLGVKASLLGQLAELGCSVKVMPAASGSKAILKVKGDGLLLAGGPGNPQVLGYIVDTVKELLGKTPVFGVGLGHQLLALALACSVRRMKIGHHGVNYPVRRLSDGSNAITVQHHSFVVDEQSVPEGVEVTHVNVNDRTVEGIGCREFGAASVQFHPSRDEMNSPSGTLVDFMSGLER